MRRTALNAAFVWASAATSAVGTCWDFEIAPERRTGGVQLNEFLPEATEFWLEEAHHAG